MASEASILPQPETTHNKYVEFALKMLIKHPEIVCLVLALAFSGFSKYAKSHSKEYAFQPRHRRFFPASSVVIDFPYGNLVTVGTMLESEEMLAVLYYAPWCANSMHARQEYERAAEYMEGKIKFVAVNCWYNEGQCRKQNRFHSYPVLFFYHTNLNGHRYNGLLQADYIIKFAETFYHPLLYITSKHILTAFIAMADNVLVGFFDFNSSPQPPGFTQFYYAAMRTLEADPVHGVRFGVITRADLANSLNITTPQTLYLIQTMNATLRYPVDRNFTASAITHWVISLQHEPTVRWLLPSGMKSISLSSELTRGPAVILFTPASPLSPVNPHMTQLREVAMSYLNCDSKQQIQDFVSVSRVLRWTHKLQDETHNCENTSEKPLSHELPLVAAKQCCLSMTSGQHNSCSICMNYEPVHPLSAVGCSLYDTSQFSPYILPETGRTSFDLHHRSMQCREAMSNYNPSEFLTLCCDHQVSPVAMEIDSEPLFDSGSTDPYVRRMVDDYEKERCRKINAQRKSGWRAPPVGDVGKDVKRFSSSFISSGCQTNSTLHFYAMDSRQSLEFATNLGVNLSPNSSALVLVDLKNENQYTMTKDLNQNNMMLFVVNHSGDNLERFLRSSPTPTHTPCTPLPNQEPPLCIHQLTSQSFQHVVMDNTKDVVLLYYAPWCGVCGSFAHIYLSLAKYFSSIKNIIFVRLNGDTDDLPWQFTSDVYPVVHMYPAGQKKNSVSFPDHQEMSLPNLVKFVLMYASENTRLEAGLNICSKSCVKSNKMATFGHRTLLLKESEAFDERIFQVEKRLLELSEAIKDESNFKAHIELQNRLESLRSYLTSLKQSSTKKKLQFKSVGELFDLLNEAPLLSTASKEQLVGSRRRWWQEWTKTDEEHRDQHDEL